MSAFWWGVVAGVMAFWAMAGIAWLVHELIQGKRAARSLTGQLESLRAELEATGGDARPSVPAPGDKKLFREPKSLASQAAIRSRAEDLLRRRNQRNAAERAQGGDA